MEIPDIRGVITPDGLFAAIAVCLASTVLLVLLTGRLVVKKIREKARFERPAIELACKALDGIELNHFIKQGIVGDLFTELSRVVRRYLDKRLSLNAFGKTTEELVTTIDETKGLSEEYKRELSDFLVHCDMVRFAGQVPTKEDVLRSIRTAKEIMERIEASGAV